MKEKSKKITLKINEDLLSQVKAIAKNKFNLREIDSYAEATREGLLEFIKKNKKYLEATN